MSSASTIRARFAPSPTGYLHVGGARTALFNWLFARRSGGVFVLRIEDTDVERSASELVDGILSSMKWLGLDWDEGPGIGGSAGPYFQSERLDRYRARAEELVSAGRAYYCYCRPEDLKAEREAAEARGESWTYDRRCARLTPDEIARRERAAVPRAIRFRMPEGRTAFDDIVHGEIAFENAVIEDFVLLRSDGGPTYHLSVVVDDVDMGITHVVRGDDHISNTPKHVLLFHAFGAPLPVFAHVPLILGPDKRRLSKRHGATALTEYVDKGYQPEAMFNFLALLGWSPGDDREIFTPDELVTLFSLEGIGTSNAVFNPEKLDWLNAAHIARMSLAELAHRTEPLLRDAGLWTDDLATARTKWWHGVLALLQPRLKMLRDVVEQSRPFLERDVVFDQRAVEKHLHVAGMAGHLAALVSALEDVSFDAASLEAALRGVADARGVKAAALIHATRVAITGRAVSPGLFETMALVGRATLVARVSRAIEEIATPSGSK